MPDFENAPKDPDAGIITLADRFDDTGIDYADEGDGDRYRTSRLMHGSQMMNGRKAEEPDPPFNLESCIDKKKCSHPLHLVLQIAFMLCVIFSLLSSIRSKRWQKNGNYNQQQQQQAIVVTSPGQAHAQQRSASSGATNPDAFKSAPTLGTIINTPSPEQTRVALFPQ